MDWATQANGPTRMVSGHIDTSERAQVLTDHVCDAVQLHARPCHAMHDHLTRGSQSRANLPAPPQTTASTANAIANANDSSSSRSRTVSQAIELTIHASQAARHMYASCH